MSVMHLGKGASGPLGVPPPPHTPPPPPSPPLEIDICVHASWLYLNGIWYKLSKAKQPEKTPPKAAGPIPTGPVRLCAWALARNTPPNTSPPKNASIRVCVYLQVFTNRRLVRHSLIMDHGT